MKNKKKQENKKKKIPFGSGFSLLIFVSENEKRNETVVLFFT